MKEFSVSTSQKNEFIDITGQVQNALDALGAGSGLIYVFVPHTTAAVTINENADPNVMSDVKNQLQEIAPEDSNYTHSEGNSDGHIKASLIGASETVFVENGKLVLGTWQGIYFCEFDGPRIRKVYVKTIG